MKHKSISQETTKPTMHFSDYAANRATLIAALHRIDTPFAPSPIHGLTRCNRQLAEEQKRIGQRIIKALNYKIEISSRLTTNNKRIVSFHTFIIKTYKNDVSNK